MGLSTGLSKFKFTLQVFLTLLSAEHTIMGKYFDMELQVIHESTSGNMKNIAILSVVFEDSPGVNNNFINDFDLINMPNPGIPQVSQFFQKPFNIWKLLYEDNQLMSPPPFSYYKYMGSTTSPPCQENVVWFVVSETEKLGSTALSMIRDALNPPGKSPHDKEPNYDGSNRYP